MKTLSTSLSHPRGQLDNRDHSVSGKLNIKTCPECGQKTIGLVCSDYRTGKGNLIPALEYFHCDSCGADFFDTEAMTRIVKESAQANKKARQTHPNQIMESENA